MPELDAVGNAKRFVREHGCDLRYSPEWGWMVWNGEVWNRSGELAERRALETINGLLIEAQSEAEIKWALRCRTMAGVRSILDLARSMDGILVQDPEAWDADPFLLNCEGGVMVDLRTGDTRPAQATDLCTRSAARWDPEAECPQWKNFLHAVTSEDLELQAYLQRMAGYGSTGLTKERAVFVLWGDGRNGKSTFVDTIARALGDYAKRMPNEAAWHDGTTANLETAAADLVGIRLAIASESEAGAKLTESFLKTVSGNAKVRARLLYHQGFEITPHFKVWMETNHKPMVRSSTAIWDRMRLVPFIVRIPEESVDLDLKDRLADQESSGVLRWIVQGAKIWSNERLRSCAAIEAGTADYRAEQDWLQEFIDEHVRFATGGHVTTSELYATYQKWAEREGLKPVSHRTLSIMLKERGLAPGMDGYGNRIWKDISLSSPPPIF